MGQSCWLHRVPIEQIGGVVEILWGEICEDGPFEFLTRRLQMPES